MENNYTKKQAKKEIEELLKSHYGTFKIVDIDLSDTDFFYYSATVICKENHCVYWVRKDNFDDSVLMDLMTVYSASITERLN